MLGKLQPQPADPIIRLSGLFRSDERTNKVDLGVGVFKDSKGNTPVMRAVKAAEKRLWEEQDTKTYVTLLGEKSYNDAMAALILGNAVAQDRISAAQAPGGTGAIHLLYELFKRATPNARLFISTPSWPNHAAIARHLGIETVSYRYFDKETCGVDFEGMKADLAQATSDDVVLLHGCCHNPTGANLSVEEWRELTALLQNSGALPLIDIAYQGFGDGLDADVEGVRYMASHLPFMMIGASCSKNFGLYRERVGAAIVINDTPERVAVTSANLASLNRANFSFPPDHGARLVSMILNDPALKKDWQDELEQMRQTMLSLRQGFADALRAQSNSERFDFIASHRGMFSLTGISADAVERLREEYGIYAVSDSRINIAGLPADRLSEVAAAFVAAENAV